MKQMKNKTKQVILFIVEGISEETAFAMIFKNLIIADSVSFRIVHGDITANQDSSVYNIKKKIGQLIADDCKKTKYKRSDFKEIIQLTDTDGVFINENDIIEEQVEKTAYEQTCIKTKKRDDIIARNKRKGGILKLLCSTDSIWGDVPYRIFFMSCNTDHVLYNRQNLQPELKNQYAYKFARKFRESPSAFLDFINNEDFATKESYSNSWVTIQNERKSLERGTNFNLYWEKHDE